MRKHTTYILYSSTMVQPYGYSSQKINGYAYVYMHTGELGTLCFGLLARLLLDMSTKRSTAVLVIPKCRYTNAGSVKISSSQQPAHVHSPRYTRTPESELKTKVSLDHQV